MGTIKGVFRRIGLSPITAVFWLLSTLVFVGSSIYLYVSTYSYLHLVHAPSDVFDLDFESIEETALNSDNKEGVISFLLTFIKTATFLFMTVSAISNSLISYFHLHFAFFWFYFLFTIFYLPFKLKNPPKKRKKSFEEKGNVESEDERVVETTEGSSPQ